MAIQCYFCKQTVQETQLIPVCKSCEAQQSSPTLAPWLTPEEAAGVLEHLGRIPIKSGNEIPERFQDALWQQAKEKK